MSGGSPARQTAKRLSNSGRKDDIRRCINFDLGVASMVKTAIGELSSSRHSHQYLCQSCLVQGLDMHRRVCNG